MNIQVPQGTTGQSPVSDQMTLKSRGSQLRYVTNHLPSPHHFSYTNTVDIWSLRNRQNLRNLFYRLRNHVVLFNIYQHHSTMLFLICFLPLHDPLAVHTLILFFAFLKGTISSLIYSKTSTMVMPYSTLHFPLHLKGFWDIQTSLDSWPLVDTL